MHYDRNNKWNWTITFLAMPIKPTRIHRNSVSIIKVSLKSSFRSFPITSSVKEFTLYMIKLEVCFSLKYFLFHIFFTSLLYISLNLCLVVFPQLFMALSGILFANNKVMGGIVACTQTFLKNSLTVAELPHSGLNNRVMGDCHLYGTFSDPWPSKGFTLQPFTHIIVTPWGQGHWELITISEMHFTLSCVCLSLALVYD